MRRLSRLLSCVVVPSAVLAGMLVSSPAAADPAGPPTLVVPDTTMVHGDAVELAVRGVGIGADGPAAGASGTVLVLTGDDLLCSFDVVVADSCTADAALDAGEHPLLAVYSGDATFPTAQATGRLTVERMPTHLVTTESISGTFGSSLPVEVTGLPVTATGDVVVRVDTEALGAGVVVEPGDDLCRAPVADGAATCLLPAELVAGEHLLEVVYEGDANHAGSQVDITLVQAWAVVEIDVADVASEAGSAATVVIDGLPVTATGTLVVEVDGVAACEVELPATACELPAAQPVGVHDVVVAYSGDDNHLPAADAARWTVAALPVQEPTPAPAPTPTPSVPVVAAPSESASPAPASTAARSPAATSVPTARPRPGLPSTGE